MLPQNSLEIFSHVVNVKNPNYELFNLDESYKVEETNINLHNEFDAAVKSKIDLIYKTLLSTK